MKNRSTAWCLALCLLLTCGMRPACRAVTGGGGIVPADSDVTAGSVGLSPADGSISVPVEVDATITTSLISVSPPADGFDFTVDPEWISDISTPAVQTANPDVTAVSHLVVPIKLEVSSVPEVGEEDIQFSGESPDDVEQSFRLADTLSGVGPSRTAILVLGTQDKVYNSREESKRYAIRPGRTGVFTAKILANGEAVIKLYGKVSLDLYGEFEFIVRSTLKISTARANEPANLYRQ